MKRFITAGTIFLLIACSDENSEKEELLPTATIEAQQNETTTQNQAQTKNDKVLTHAEEAMVFLEKAAEITSNLETVWFLSMVFNTSYLNLDEPEYSSFFDNYSTYAGTMQRNPKLAYIMKFVDNSSGTLVIGQKDLYDESSRLAYTNTEYFDPELGCFSVSGDYSYGGVVESDEQPYIGHDDLDDSFRTY